MTEQQMPAPDPNDTDAAELAGRLRVRQSLLRGRAPAYRTSRAEADWLTQYALAEDRIRRDDREAQRQARRAR